jgi:16S rRNA (cytosine967-C5)-methyltransferase
LDTINFKDQEEQDLSYLNGARIAAVKILSRFERSDSYLDKLIFHELKKTKLSSLDTAFLYELVNGVIRWKEKLDYVLVGFYHGDYMKLLNIIKNALRVGLYQIMFLDKIPVHAAINESVEYIKKIQGERTANIANGVLRNIDRNVDNIRFPDKETDPIYHFSVVFSHPRWMVRRWEQRFDRIELEEILYINNKRPYVPLRVNTLQTNLTEIKKVLDEIGLSYFVSDYLPNSLILKNPKLDISSLDIFKDGFVTIQDPSASMAAKLSNAKPGDFIIDACAAPGGKSFYMAEMTGDNCKIISLDKYESKLRQIDENAQRLKLKSIETMVGDAESIDFDQKADIVFCDVPCSGLGTLSKKPDIKWKRDIDDIYILSGVQKRILENAARSVKPGGALIYSTCTIEPEENREVIEKFLNKNPEFEIDLAEKYLPYQVCNNGCMETYLHKHFIDGAFAARMIRKE